MAIVDAAEARAGDLMTQVNGLVGRWSVTEALVGSYELWWRLFGVSQCDSGGVAFTESRGPTLADDFSEDAQNLPATSVPVLV